MDMPPQSLAFLLASIAGPATAVAAESPEMVFPATAAGVLMFVGAAIMKLSNTATAHLVEMRDHRVLEKQHWDRQRDHWRDSK